MVELADQRTSNVPSGGLRRLGLLADDIRDLVPRGFHLDVVKHHRREDHARNAHQLFSDYQPDQREPHRVFDPVADDFAVEEVFKFVDDHQEDQREQGDLGGNRESDTNDERVTDDVANDRKQPAKKREHNDHHDVVVSVPDQEESGQDRVNQRNHDLRPDNLRKAAVESLKALAQFANDRGIQAPFDDVGIVVHLPFGAGEQADGHHESDDQHRELKNGRPRVTSHIGDLVFDLAEGDGLEAGVIGEGQFDLLLFGEVDHSWDGRIGDFRQCLVSLLGEIEQPVTDRRDGDDVDRDAEGLAAAKAELAQGEVTEEDCKRQSRQVQYSDQRKEERDDRIGNAGGLAHVRR